MLHNISNLACTVCTHLQFINICTLHVIMLYFYRSLLFFGRHILHFNFAHQSSPPSWSFPPLLHGGGGTPHCVLPSRTYCRLYRDYVDTRSAAISIEEALPVLALVKPPSTLSNSSPPLYTLVHQPVIVFW
jgi:hypothetical protein